MRILLIEDNAADARLIKETLAERSASEIDLDWTDRLSTGLLRLREGRIDGVLLDLSLPDSQGTEGLEKIQAQAPDLAVLVLTHLDDEGTAIHAVRKGAQDYLIKGETDSGTLTRAIRYAIERKRAEKAIRDSETRLRAIIDSALDAVISIDAQGRVVDWNGRAEVMFGWTSSEAVGETLAELIVPPQQRDAHTRGLRHFMETGQGPILHRRIEVTAMRRDGSEFPAELSISPIKQGNTYLFNAFVADISERKQAEKTLVRLAAIVESSDDAIISTTLNGIVKSWNNSAERIFGYPEVNALEQSIHLLIPPDHVEPGRETLDRLKAGECIHYEETIRGRKDGKDISVAMAISPIKDRDGTITGISKIARDVTEQKNLEEQLRQSQKMEGIGQLAGGIAHDFNNMLTVINSYSDMVLGEVGFGNPFIRNGVEQIREAGHRAASLTRQLLTFSRRQVLDIKVLDLNEVVSNIAKLLRRLIGENISLIFCPDPALGSLRGDPGQLEQIIMNLAVNARDAMPHGGSLTIETKNVELDATYARLHVAVQPGPYVMLAVSDTGCGMDAETQSRIFEPFFTTKGPGGGTGLGLATLYGIVKQSGGNIWVDSAVGKGTTIKVFLPRVKEKSQQVMPASVPDEALRGSETILLVEDEELVRALTEAILERYGYTVITALSASDALRFAKQSADSIDLLLTDTIMPDMSGPDLARQLLAIRPDIKILHMSGYTDKMITHTAAMEPGAFFLQKPFTPQVLSKRLREILHPTASR